MNTEAIDQRPFVPKRLLSVADYHRMAEAGVFAPDERVELIEGEIVSTATYAHERGPCDTRRLLPEEKAQRVDGWPSPSRRLDEPASSGQ